LNASELESSVAARSSMLAFLRFAACRPRWFAPRGVR